MEMTNMPLPFLEETIEIPSYLTDDSAHLGISALFKLLQEASERHASLLGAGWYELQERGYFWVVSRIQLKIHQLPKWRDKILLRTWVKPSEAATSPRDFEIEDMEGRPLASARALWAIIDTEHNRPQRMNMFDGLFAPQDRSAIGQKPIKIPPVLHPDILYGPKDVVFSDIDMNHHVNNAHYIQWTFDAMNEEFRKTHRLSDMTVNFIAQAKLGEQYKVLTEQISATEFRTSIVSGDNLSEYCRIQSRWEPVILNEHH
jgi:acyl-ACP thioesterase